MKVGKEMNNEIETIFHTVLSPKVNYSNIQYVYDSRDSTKIIGISGDCSSGIDWHKFKEEKDNQSEQKKN
jgi:hypothetical protein